MVRPTLLLYPSDTLKQKSDPVSLEWAQTDEFKETIQSMVDAMLFYGGLGLSCIQIGGFHRAFVMRTKQGVLTHVNPEIEVVDGELEEMDEGCLSLPGIIEKVRRFPFVVISSMDVTGERKRYDLEGIEAQCAQHEMDHLDGKMFSDGYGPMKRDIVKRKIRKQLRLNPRFRR